MGDWMEAINYDKKANGKIQTNAKGEKQSAEMEEMRTEYHKYCPKSKSNNIIYCPKEIIKKKIKEKMARLKRIAEEEGMKLRKLNKRFKRISKKRKSKKKKLRTGRKSDRKEKQKTKRKRTA